MRDFKNRSTGRLKNEWFNRILVLQKTLLPPSVILVSENGVCIFSLNIKQIKKQLETNHYDMEEISQGLGDGVKQLLEYWFTNETSIPIKPTGVHA